MITSKNIGYFIRKLFSRPVAFISVLILVMIIIIAIAAPILSPHDPTFIDVTRRLRPPAWSSGGDINHLLGTDSLGRDVLSRLIFGSRISLIVGVTVVLISGTMGLFLGLTAGYLGGIVDDIIMRIADITLAFPFILLAIAVLAVLGPGLPNLIFVLVIWGWVQYARIARGQTFSLREKEFVEAARALGVGHTQIIVRHILPNTWAPIIVIGSFAVATTILFEAALSFLGLGVPPRIPTWGAMLAEGREHIYSAWWIVTFPGLAIMITVLSINFLGDWLRDYFDPRLRN